MRKSKLVLAAGLLSGLLALILAAMHAGRSLWSECAVRGIRGQDYNWGCRMFPQNAFPSPCGCPTEPRNDFCALAVPSDGTKIFPRYSCTPEPMESCDPTLYRSCGKIYNCPYGSPDCSSPYPGMPPLPTWGCHDTGKGSCTTTLYDCRTS